MWSVWGDLGGLGRRGSRAGRWIETKLLQWSRPELGRSEAEGSSRMEEKEAVTKERAEVCDRVDRGALRRGRLE